MIVCGCVEQIPDTQPALEGVQSCVAGDVISQSEDRWIIFVGESLSELLKKFGESTVVPLDSNLISSFRLFKLKKFELGSNFYH